MVRMIRPRLVSRSGRYLASKTRRGRALVRARRSALGGGRLAKLVRRIANRGVEVKHVGQNVIDADFNSTITSASECYRILPDVTEGTDGHQRIGDKITPRYLIVKGKLHYSQSVAGNYINPSTARLFILTQRDIKLSTDVSSRVDIDHLLKDNIGTDVGRRYNGGPFDNLAPVNKDQFKVLMDRKVKLRAQIEKQLGDNNTVIGYASQKTYTFYCKIKCPATLYFGDGSGNTPNNFAPFFCMGGVNDDSSSPWTLNTPYHVTVQSELYFVDK